MNEDSIKARLLATTALASNYCLTLENAREMEKDEFVKEMLSLLPAIYLDFSSIDVEDLPEQSEFEYFASYVDEDFYESVRRNVETLMGPDDVFLETFEEDMKYSDTPIGSSVAECLADIFQPLCNYISVVRDSDGESAPAAFREGRENFEGYWSQTLCNVVRALNHIRYSPS